MSLLQMEALYSGPAFLKDREAAVFLAVAYLHILCPGSLRLSNHSLQPYNLCLPPLSAAQELPVSIAEPWR